MTSLIKQLEIDDLTPELQAVFLSNHRHSLETKSLKPKSKILQVDRGQYSCQQLAKALVESEQRYILATQITNDGLWDWELSSNQIYFSPRWKSILGYSDTEIGNQPEDWFALVHQQDLSKLKSSLLACLSGETPQFEIEYSLRHRNGEYRCMYCRCIAAQDETQKVIRLIGSQTDITQSKQIKARLHYETCYDRLTGLPNRSLFIQQLEQSLKLSQQKSPCCLAILFVDLDRFKTINDSLGHGIGDRFLVEVANKLKKCLRQQDLVARLGGDEFAILLTQVKNVRIATEVAYRIQQELALPVQIGDRLISITASVGIAFNNNQGDYSYSTESLRDAEIAMYQAKAQGKARHAVYEEAMYLQRLQTIQLEQDLRRGIEAQQFELYYQPIVTLATNKIVGFEALVRWHHPLKGMISPSEFIPLAEETGLIVPLGWWILREACSQMFYWQQNNPDKANLSISVNISSQQFSQPYSSYLVAQILRETGINPQCLKLEITESQVIQDIELALTTLNKLKQLGVQLSMDDFGTGYSSLSYLHRLPVDILKIDRSFIMGIELDPSKLELVKTIIKLAEVFNLNVIAEGVESHLQRDRLLNLECKYGQGYLFSQALPKEIATALIKASGHKL